MAGGIFLDQPFVFNIKCAVFGIALMAGYWFLPRQNVFILPLLFVVGYVAMAFYDNYYDCNVRLHTGTAIGVGTIDSIFKPIPPADPSVINQLPKVLQDSLLKRNIYLFHILAIAPLLIYVGMFGKFADRRVFSIVMYIGFLALAYHGYRLFSTLL